MTIVTLTTDFGLKDYYSARIKGTILSRTEEVCFIDISHNIPNYDIVQAAFVFRNCWTTFPKGTIHLLSVNDQDVAATRFVLSLCKGHFFVAPDNGLLPLVLEEPDILAFSLPWPVGDVFPIATLFAEVVAGITRSTDAADLGYPAITLQQRLTFQPVIGKNQIRGAVVYIDHYENVVVNVSRTLFERIRQNRPFALYFKRNDPITMLSQDYADVVVGESLCHFNSADFLEIAINRGKAASLFGLKIDDAIQIDFID